MYIYNVQPCVILEFYQSLFLKTQLWNTESLKIRGPMVWPHGNMVLHDRSWLPLLQFLTFAMKTWIESRFLSLTLLYDMYYDYCYWCSNSDTRRVPCFYFPWSWEKENQVFRYFHLFCTKLPIGSLLRIHNVAWSIMHAQ